MRKNYRLIHRAYPQLHLRDVLKIEARAMNVVPAVYNRQFPQMPLTDYAVHVDELKYHTGQLHLQGRIALLGKTAKGKPSFSLNQAVKQSVEPYLDEYKILYQRVHGKPLKRKPKNARERLSAYRLLADDVIYWTVAHELDKQLPKVNFDFHFVRTQAKSVSHERWQREQDNQWAERNDKRAKQTSEANHKVGLQAHRIDSKAGVTDDITHKDSAGVVWYNPSTAVSALSAKALPKISVSASVVRTNYNRASLVCSSADELVPKFKHRYSASASSVISSAISSASSTLANDKDSVILSSKLDSMSNEDNFNKKYKSYKASLDLSASMARASITSARQSVEALSQSTSKTASSVSSRASAVNHQARINKSVVGGLRYVYRKLFGLRRSHVHAGPMIAGHHYDEFQKDSVFVRTFNNEIMPVIAGIGQVITGQFKLIHEHLKHVKATIHRLFSSENKKFEQNQIGGTATPA